MNWHERYLEWFDKSWYSRYRKQHRLGWYIHEEIGVVCINNYAVARVYVDVDNLPIPKAIIKRH